MTTAAEKLAGALATAGLDECPKCKCLYAGRHYCYEDTLDALLDTVKIGKAECDSRWELSAILSSHTGYEYSVVLNRNVSGAHGNGRVALGMAFASPREALARAIKAAAAIDANPAIVTSDEATLAWLREPEA